MALAAALCLWAGTAAADTPLALKLDETWDPAPPRATGGGPRTRAVVLRARELRSRPELDTVAEGEVELRSAGTVIRADRLSYDNADDRATARGQVRIERDGNVYQGPELQLQLQRFEGFFLQPEYWFARTAAGGRAQRIDFLDASRSVAVGATYTSCTPENSGDPDWLLSTERVKLDFEANEGVAEGATLRFLGVPILAAPVLSFPLSDNRKSGWLPPSVNLDSRSGLELAVPFYWNIAPQRDATFTPTLRARRGLALDSEFRYLEDDYQGSIALNLMPTDRVAGRSRHSLQFKHEGRWDGLLDYSARWQRVSDDDFWKDFPRDIDILTPRLLPLDLQARRTLRLGAVEAEGYARLQKWQVLQSGEASTAIVAPYERSPQLGLRGRGEFDAGWQLGFETEFNRFTRPDGSASASLPTGWRWHALATLGRSWEGPGWWLRPQLALNLASYRTEEGLGGDPALRQSSRSVPSFSVDAGMVFERESHWFGRAQRQTLEPRLLYVNTPYRDQALYPKFDTARRDFNLISVFSENTFSGIDRVADAHQMTAGVTTRLLDETTGAETLRLGVAQRFLFRDQRITPGEVTSEGIEPEGPVFSQRFSDLLLEGSSTLVPGWNLDAAVQYSADTARPLRSILGARWSPGEFRTVSANYRFARGLSEQLELGWQWPVYRRTPLGEAASAGSSGGCGGTLYSVGRLNYSMKDSRITDSIVGLEYDAGCWIGRVVAERLSTGRTEATTRLLVQLELTGLSRLGSNPLKVLKDNIPGYRLLRDERQPQPLATP